MMEWTTTKLQVYAVFLRIDFSGTINFNCLRRYIWERTLLSCQSVSAKAHFSHLSRICLLQCSFIFFSVSALLVWAQHQTISLCGFRSTNYYYRLPDKCTCTVLIHSTCNDECTCPFGPNLSHNVVNHLLCPLTTISHGRPSDCSHTMHNTRNIYERDRETCTRNATYRANNTTVQHTCTQHVTTV